MGITIIVIIMPQISERPGNLYFAITYDAIADVITEIVGASSDSQSEFTNITIALLSFACST